MSYSRIREGICRVFEEYLQDIPGEERIERLLDAVILRRYHGLIVKGDSTYYHWNELFKKFVPLKGAEEYLDSDTFWQDLGNMLKREMEIQREMWQAALDNLDIRIGDENCSASSKSTGIVTVDYEIQKKFGTRGHKLNRPFVEVIVHGAGKKKQRIWCLLDSGADEMMLDFGIAKHIGIDLSKGINAPITTASGDVAAAILVDKLSMEIEGQPIEEMCYFINGGIPLLGRNTILAALEFGMNTTGWLGKK